MKRFLRYALVVSGVLLLLFAGLILLAYHAHQKALACVRPAQPMMKTHTMPSYPPLSETLNEEGVSRLAVAVGLDGSAAMVEVVRSSGSVRLDDAAVSHVKAHWKWYPAQDQRCQPVMVRKEITITWRLFEGRRR